LGYNFRWEYGIKMDLKTIVHEDLDLTNLLQDNGHILSFVGMAMNLRNVYNSEKFTSSCNNLERACRGSSTCTFLIVVWKERLREFQSDL
jgi:hypothetical protein